MKQILLVAALCILATVVKAQVQNVVVTNNTPYDVYVVLHGDVSGFGCLNRVSTLIKNFPPGYTGTINGSSVYMSPGDDIIGVDVYDSWPFCGPTLQGSIGESCFSANTMIGTSYPTKDANSGGSCITAGTITNVIWANIGGGTATLDFN